MNGNKYIMNGNNNFNGNNYNNRNTGGIYNDDKGSNKGKIVIFIVLLILVVLLGVNLVFPDLLKFNKSNTNTEPGVPTPQVSEEPVNPSPEASADVKVTEPFVGEKVDLSKYVLADSHYSITRSAGKYFNVSMSGFNTKKIKLNVNKKYPDYTEIDSKKGQSYDSYDITFTQNVVDILCGSIGQSAGKDYIIYLMADGTLEYTPVRDADDNGEMKSYGMVPGVGKIIKIFEANYNPGGTGYNTFIAQDTDGKIYNLNDYLKNK